MAVGRGGFKRTTPYTGAILRSYAAGEFALLVELVYALPFLVYFNSVV